MDQPPLSFSLLTAISAFDSLSTYTSPGREGTAKFMEYVARQLRSGNGVRLYMEQSPHGMGEVRVEFSKEPFEPFPLEMFADEESTDPDIDTAVLRKKIKK